ncbi:CLUMA_CG006363, isoform A [Clunio marinus]|uniref:CLUMA_CG006363, isoform A n=1 Tax=Clunio marinus TaxID=568069 RepID=A0A1J1HXX3_9DIPT|nr:CLUMA_CG006363, isoform A [Clunio marinus]
MKKLKSVQTLEAQPSIIDLACSGVGEPLARLTFFSGLPAQLSSPFFFRLTGSAQLTFSSLLVCSAHLSGYLSAVSLAHLDIFARLSIQKGVEEAYQFCLSLIMVVRKEFAVCFQTKNDHPQAT